MSTQNQSQPTHQQLVETIVKLDARLEEQARFIKTQGETIISMKRAFEESNAQKLNQNNIGKIETQSDRERLPMLEKFQGDRSMWDEWHLDAIHKLEKDGPFIGDGFDQFMYVYAKLDGEAKKMVSTTARSLSTNRSGDGIKFLEYLNTVFGDPNKKARAQQQLYSLKQRDKESFATFLPKFETILAISKEMRTALIGKKLPDIWSDCISELLTISSEIIAINQQFRTPFSSPPSMAKPADKPTSMEWEPIKAAAIDTKGTAKRATWVKKETLAIRRKHGLCVRCGHKGHIAPNCKFLPPLSQNLRMNTSKMVNDEEVLALAEPEEVEETQGKDELL